MIRHAVWLYARFTLSYRDVEYLLAERGLVNAVVPLDKLDEEVDRWCRELLALSPSCLKVLKASFRLHMEPIMKDKMVNIVDRVVPGYHQSGEQQEGAQAFLEKRAPDFGPWR